MTQLTRLQQRDDVRPEGNLNGFLMRALAIIATIVVMSVFSQEASAQGKGAKAKQAPGQTKQVSTNDAVSASRDILVKHGYQFVRVETVGTTQVIYYRRGNMGRGKGLGPLEKMVVRPSNSIVLFDGGPSGVVLDLKIKLGL